jgi:hypothetical protein
MRYKGINNNIFHKLQEKNTLAFSNCTLQIKSLMKSAHAKHFQKLVRYNSYLGPLITSPPQTTDEEITDEESQLKRSQMKSHR